MSDLISSIIETIAKYQRATKKPYQSIKHVMLKEGELLVPSDKEEYIFRFDEGWKIVSQNEDTIIMEIKQNYITKTINKRRSD